MTMLHQLKTISTLLRAPFVVVILVTSRPCTRSLNLPLSINHKRPFLLHLAVLAWHLLWVTLRHHLPCLSKSIPHCLCIIQCDLVAGAQRLQLHPVLASSSNQDAHEAHIDQKMGSVRVPGRTVAVFVEPR